MIDHAELERNGSGDRRADLQRIVGPVLHREVDDEDAHQDGEERRHAEMKK